MGLTEDEMDLSPMRSLVNRIRGWNKLKLQEYKEHWIRDRYFTVRLINIQLSKKDQIRNPVDFVRFSWEEKPEVKQLSKNEFLKFID